MSDDIANDSASGGPSGGFTGGESSTADLSPSHQHRAEPIFHIGERPGDLIGPYKLMSVLGEGGFGVVYLAERREPHIQRVALKIIKPGMDSRAVIARFEAERQALAVMDHPNIAKVFDAGATATGRPYFVMEHVQGEPITEYCDRHNYTIKQRLELFIPVCEAVHHAHMKGIIHRDIKPSNILVMVKDGHAIPKVIDFGVAKAISHTLTDKTIFTEQGQIIGTPEYMSPEQAEMGAIDIDTRTDVYSLGVVLYELLTGLLPFDPKELRSKGYAEIQRIIREVEPPKPSTRLTSLKDDGTRIGATESDPLAPGSAEGTARPAKPSAVTIAHHRQTHIDHLARELRRELDWIPLKAIRKDRTQRYRTPTDLSDDIVHYLAGQPLEAGPEATTYKLKKFLHRNKGPIVVAGMITIVLGLGSIGIADAIASRSKEADQRKRAEYLEERTITFIAHLAFAEEDYKAAGARYRQVLDLRRKIYGDEHANVVHAIHDVGSSLYKQGRLDEAEPYLQTALDKLRAMLGDDHLSTISATFMMADLRRSQGRTSDAEEYFESVVRQLSSKPDNAYYVEQLAESYELWHGTSPGKGYDIKAAEWRARLKVMTTEQQQTTDPAVATPHQEVQTSNN